MKRRNGRHIIIGAAKRNKNRKTARRWSKRTTTKNKCSAGIKFPRPKLINAVWKWSRRRYSFCSLNYWAAVINFFFLERSDPDVGHSLGLLCLLFYFIFLRTTLPSSIFDQELYFIFHFLQLPYPDAVWKDKNNISRFPKIREFQRQA